ncbi:2'-5' RNA ligase [Actinomyces howellii]|uniref:2'-5' RNA ligase n=2 Tax=Actinomyces howellii TaxID=52771 RepID=A0A448HFM4_9ACTO|nr:2'-5' RNA ligase [Actinomyces howellii]
MDLPTTSDSERVLGLTIAVPEPWAEQVRRVRLEAGDPLAGTVPPHITLLPPTAVPRARIEEVIEHVGRVARGTSPFEVRATGSRTFRPVSPVAYLALATGAAQVDALQRELRRAEGPLAGPLRFPFHAHVTLAHLDDDKALDAAQAAGRAIDAVFTVERIHLHLLEGEVWQPLAAPSLGALEGASLC